MSKQTSPHVKQRLTEAHALARQLEEERDTERALELRTTLDRLLDEIAQTLLKEQRAS